jgi:hypothetical protein
MAPPMLRVPIRPAYGPTLGRLLSPRWRAARAPVRLALAIAAAALTVAVAAAVLTLLNAHYSQGGRVPFSFGYRSLYRVAPDPGGYVKIERHSAGARLEDSLAVEPLTLPPYEGELSGELPLYAAGYIRGLASRYRGFVLRAEGKTRVNTVRAYNVLYTAVIDGQTLWGRDVLLLPPRAGAREGVDIVMLTAPDASPQVDSPLEVASAGVLLRPLKTFTFG